MSSYDHADPSFGAAARTGFARPTPATGSSLPGYPPGWDDEPAEPAAAYCNGPGPLRIPDPDNYDRTPGDLTIIAEPCPACRGQVRNHRTSRIVGRMIELPGLAS